MQLDEPFPLQLIPLRARKAVLQEFAERCPSINEVITIPDSDWLKKPGVGPAALRRIHSVIPASPGVDRISSVPNLSDAELLRCLCTLQNDLRHILDALKTRVSTVCP